MGRLSDFKSYLDERMTVLKDSEERLCALQSKYESFFNEVSRVRETELGQLSGYVLANRAGLPKWLDAALSAAETQVAKEFDQEIARLRERHAAQLKETEARRQRSVWFEKQIRQKNSALDAEEEALKGRNEQLLRQIADYNDRLRQLSHGFGFFANFFRMRGLAAQRHKLDQEQADVAARIEALRVRWRETETEHAKREQELQGEWVKLESEAAAIQAKIDYLTESRARIITRSTLERVLYEKATEPPKPKPGDPACPRCKSPNPSSNHFCHICAQRLSPDRPDLEGSVEEIAELNLHHSKFADGVKSCQEIIGLVRGLKSGVEAFTQSVQKMIDNEKRYPLPKLKIDIPEKSLQYGWNFDGLKEAASKDMSLHPRDFADQVEALVQKVLTEANIKAYFETMGEELSRQAEAQWG